MIYMVLCNICSGDTYTVIYEGKDGKNYQYYSSGNYGKIIRCNNCGLIYVNPLGKDIEKNYETIEDKDYLKSKEARIETSKRDLKEIEKYKKEGKILDIGCGPGFFLKVAKDNKWDEYGVELSKWACDYGKNTGVNIINKRLERAKFNDKFFDVITLWDVIEHVEYPSSLLLEINRILKNDGIIVLNTPNIGSIFAKIMGKRWWNLIGMHIYYFDKKTIRKILEKNGFKIIKIKSYSRIITPRYAVEWLKNYKMIYGILKFIFDKTFLGNVRPRVNFFDNIVVYAKKSGPSNKE